MATGVVSQGVGFSGIAATAGAVAGAGAVGAGTAAAAAATAGGALAAAGGAIMAAPLTVGITTIAAGMFLNVLIMKLVYLVLFVAMSYLIIDKCCDVIDILPAKVMGWINLRANGDGSDMDQRVAAIATNTESEGRRFAAGGVPKDQDKDKDGKDDRTGANLNKNPIKP